MGSVGGEEAIHQPTGHDERILVSVRLRPLNEKELARNDLSDWECINDTTIIYRSNLSASDRSLYPTAYSFDNVFRSDCSTRQVYEKAAKEVALSVVGGINSSIFAYGQTSSGKTYTMSGITEYTVADIFKYIEMHTEREFVLKFSAIEIYNESVRDLLSPDCTPLRLLDDPERGTVVEKLTEETIRDWEHFTELISFSEAQRQIGETALNEASSRSHQILRLTIESSSCEFLGNDKSSSLSASVNFVDLAGSERASQTNSAGTRLKEGCHINRSLLTLGTVIRKLSKGRNGHFPFRDSKLTRILQSSLGGNARTAIICTMSPARSYVEQTRNTLLFASCAKEVTTNAQVNVVMSDKALVKQLQKELARLEDELRNSGPPHVTSDASAMLREKDRQIEMLKKEVKELTLQRDLAQSRINEMIRVHGDDVSSIDMLQVESLDAQYPNLHVRNSWNIENQREEPNVLSLDGEESVRSFDASQYSDGHSFSSDDNLFQLPDLEKNLLVRSSSPGPPVKRNDSVTNDLDKNNVRDQHEEDNCKEVRCIELEDLSTNTHKQSNPEDSRSNTYTNSNASTPRASKTISGLIVADNRDKEKVALSSSRSKEDKRVNHLPQDFVLPSPKEISVCMTGNSRSGTSRAVRLSRSKSCKASLMRNFSSDWFEDEDDVQNTPPIGNEKHFPGRPNGFPKNIYALNYNARQRGLSCNGHGNFVQNSAADIVQNVKSSTNKESKCDAPLPPKGKESENLKRLNLLADREAPETGLDPIISAQDVKDVGLDPMEADDREIHSDWPSKFKRLQREIIEFWGACNVSLVHRTYFFLLFKGDQTDSFYMEVELRRLSYLKQAFSKGNQTVEDGRILKPESSMRYLRKERQMLSKQMHKRLSKDDRQNLYLKWGLRLSSKNRSLQLAHRLWTDTKDMDHIRDSASIVAKLVGLVEPEQAFKEMFGLNFTPQPTSRKSFSWTASVRHIL
ncbi:kinesin-like protein KIN-7E [Vigna radiata var. radiata]|uniref:Kinesin-like protein n=1 Tax=Vigna radiata var. radiata TaxID=3916 RepID=A0A1S3VRC7_VIGRR|nr:kinesin-like protein KIN-7E [Vigna radiata var. radiata]XP_022643288.1 kinesin-like protein KIN-7E [Vigna radiata var. radiata]